MKPTFAGIAFLVGFLPAIAAANPVNPGGEALGLVGIALTGISLSVEVAFSAALLVLICRVEHRVRPVAGLLGLNLLSYAIFVAFLFPRFPYLVVIELMIWLLEAVGMMFLVRWAGGQSAQGLASARRFARRESGVVFDRGSDLELRGASDDGLTNSGILGIWVCENDLGDR